MGWKSVLSMSGDMKETQFVFGIRARPGIFCDKWLTHLWHERGIFKTFPKGQFWMRHPGRVGVTQHLAPSRKNLYRTLVHHAIFMAY